VERSLKVKWTWKRGSGETSTAVAVAVCLAASACGGAPSGPSSGPGTKLAAATSTYSAYTGGKPGKADSSRSPISLGWINNEGGVPSFPEATVAAEAAVRFVNEQLGGVGGHPVSLSKCIIVSAEEQGQTCAQQLLNAPSVNVITEGGVAVGAQAFHRTLDGRKPVVIPVPLNIADATARNAYAPGAGVFGTSPGFVGYVTGYLHARSVALLNPGDDPTGVLAGKQIKDGLEKAGVTVKQAAYQTTASDYLSFVVASSAATADATVGLFPSPPTCIAGAKALQQANVTKPIVGLGLCIADPVQKALGDFPKWTYIFATENPNLPAADPFVAGYVDVMHAYAPQGANLGGFAPSAFAGILMDIKLLNQVGTDNLTAETIAAAARAYRGPAPLLPPDLNYGTIPGLPTLGTLSTRAYTYSGDANWKDATGGKWITP